MKLFFIVVVCFLVPFTQSSSVVQFSDYYTFTSNVASYYTDSQSSASGFSQATYTSNGNGFSSTLSFTNNDQTYVSYIVSLCNSHAISPINDPTHAMIITPNSGNPTAFAAWFTCEDSTTYVENCNIQVIVTGGGSGTYSLTTTGGNSLFWGFGNPSPFTHVLISSNSDGLYANVNFLTVGIYSANGGTGTLLSYCPSAVSTGPGTTTTATSTTTTTTTSTTTTTGITTTTSGSTTTSTSGGLTSQKLNQYCYNLTISVSKALQGSPQYFTFQDFGCNTTDWNIVSVNTTVLYSYQNPNQIKLSIQPSKSGARPVHYQIMSSDHQYTHNLITKVNIVNHNPVINNATFTWAYPRSIETFPNWNLLSNCTDLDGDSLTVVQILKTNSRVASTVVQLNNTTLYFIPEKVVLSVLPTGAISLTSPTTNTNPITAGSPLPLFWKQDLNFQFQITDGDVTNQYAWGIASINSV